MKLRHLSSVALLALSACRADAPPAATSTQPDTIRTIVDSIFPVEEEIRRFKAARNGAAASELANAATSRDEVVRRFLKAVAARDSADLRALTLNAAEFIDLYYPSSMYSHPPYKQSPEVVWLMQQQNSDQGLRRVLNRFGGQPGHLRSYTCKPEPRVEGENRFWDECTITWAPSSQGKLSARLFSTIIERGGRFKILSYANQF
jgi:hypothetical protein